MYCLKLRRPVHPVRVTPNPGEAEHGARRPWALMASGSPRRPTLKEAGFWRPDWNAGPACSSPRSLGLLVCVSGSAKGTCAWNALAHVRTAPAACADA